MIIRIKNNGGRFGAMALWPFIILKDGQPNEEEIIRHEKIHHAQQKEMLLVFFYVWYGLEFVLRLLATGNSRKAYKELSFEQEANAYEHNPKYLDIRKAYSWTKFL